MVATASTEHSYWLALAFVAWTTQTLAFLAVFVYATLATHATQVIAFEWKPGFSKCGTFQQAKHFASSWVWPSVLPRSYNGLGIYTIAGKRCTANTSDNVNAAAENLQSAVLCIWNSQTAVKQRNDAVTSSTIYVRQLTAMSVFQERERERSMAQDPPQRRDRTSWNQLPLSLKSSSLTIGQFSKQLKTLMFKQRYLYT